MQKSGIRLHQRVARRCVHRHGLSRKNGHTQRRRGQCHGRSADRRTRNIYHKQADERGRIRLLRKRALAHRLFTPCNSPPIRLRPRCGRLRCFYAIALPGRPQKAAPTSGGRTGDALGNTKPARRVIHIIHRQPVQNLFIGLFICRENII
jgi:hypothetical protein